MSENRPPFVVGIGASAGGLEALEQFFGAVPENSALAFIVIQHLSPDFKSLMVELLERHTSLAVQRIENDMLLEPGKIYLNPPRHNVLLNEGRFRLIEQEESGGLNMPIDVCFRSLARDLGESSIAVILSGTGSDGSRGIVEVHRAGGLVVAQDPESSGFDGMPRSAQASGVVDALAAPGELAQLVHDYAARPAGFRERLLDASEEVEHELTALLRVFRSNYGIDFAQYKPATFHRRLERRMRLDGYDEIEVYLEHLQKDPDLLNQLYRDVLVEVTEFFRDRAAFDLLEQSVIPDLVAQTNPKEAIRVWVAGCATGEEAYSIAMLFMNACAPEQREFKVFATDVHQNSLQIASTGVYTKQAVGRIPEPFRERFVERRGDLFHIREDLRRSVLFAPHDVTKDPPFTKCDLVTCRNMLIYLLTDAQHRAIANFHFALKTSGLLFLGPSETAGKHEREFETVDQRWRIYRKLRDVRLGDVPRGHLSSALQRAVRAPVAAVASPLVDRAENSNASGVLEQILEEHLPPSLLVNEHFELVHSFGEARRILVQPKGSSTLDVVKMVEGDLRTALAAALNRSARQASRAAYRRVRVGEGDSAKVMDLSVTPYEKGGSRMYLVRLEEQVATTPVAEAQDEVYDATGERQSRISELEEELEATRDALKSTVEDLEAANEELQSTNEELVASNEELQSTNEELHSVNEELYTVNAEHQRKIEELTELSADMDNLLTCTEIGTIFLDEELRIRSFTPAIAETFHMLDRDVGRPIEHIASKLDNLDVTADARQVLETNEALESKVQSAEGATYLQRMTPYRAPSRDVAGVVLTYVAVPQLDAVERRFESLVQNLTDVVWVSAAPDGGKVEYVNDSFERIWGVPAERLYADGHLWVESIVEEDRERVMEAFERNLAKGEFDELYRISLPDGQVRWIHDRGQPVYDSTGTLLHFAGVARDVTVEQLAAGSIGPLIESSSDAILVLDLEDGNVLAGNSAAARVYGYDPDEVAQLKVKELIPKRLEGEANTILRRLRGGESVSGVDTWRVRKDGKEVHLSLNAWSFRVGGRSAAVSLARELGAESPTTDG